MHVTRALDWGNDAIAHVLAVRPMPPHTCVCTHTPHGGPPCPTPLSTPAPLPPCSPEEADFFYVPLPYACLFDVYGWNPIPRIPADVHGGCRAVACPGVTIAAWRLGCDQHKARPGDACTHQRRAAGAEVAVEGVHVL